MKLTRRLHPDAPTRDVNIDTGDKNIVKSLLIILSRYDDLLRGELVLIEFSGEEMTWIQDTYGAVSPLQDLCRAVNERYMENVSDYVEGYAKTHPSQPPKLEVVQRVTSTNGKLVVASDPVLQILTPPNYHPQKDDGEINDGEYVVPLDYRVG